jgi:hypothetical protein
MAKAHEAHLDSSGPALVVTYGNTTNKVRPLDRDVFILGRAAGCDLKLTSPDVAPIHCLVVRTADGWRLRDCTGRGTRVNGKGVHDEALNDGDVFQVGAFSFQAHLPASAAHRPAAGPSRTPPPRATPLPAAVPVKAAPMAIPLNAEEIAANSPKSRRLERSRRRFAELALALRRRLRESREAEDRLARFKTTLDQQAESLRQRQRDYEGRMAKLEEGERDLAEDRAALEKDQEALRERQERVDKELTRREAESEGRLHSAWQECQARIAAAEAEKANQPPEAAPLAAPATGENAAELVRRRQELDHYAGHLREERRKLDEEARRLAEEAARLRKEEELRSKPLPERPASAQPSGMHSRSLPAVKNLRGELEKLRQEIENRDVALHEMRRALQEAQEAASREVPPSLEAELVRLHLEIERERKALDEQVRQMQMRSSELEEAVREAELQMSRERAQLGRERSELNRIRDELRTEKEQLQRGAGARDRLAPVQRLKEELAQKREAEGTPLASAGNGLRRRSRVGDKLRK